MHNTNAITELAAGDADREQLLLLSALSVCWLRPQSPAARELLEDYRRRGLAVAALREAALQLFLLAGFQASLEAAFQIREVFGSGLPPEDSEAAAGDTRNWLERGYALQERVYCDNVARLRVNLAAASPELAEWTVLVGYGLVLSRPGLPAAWRELLEVAVLAVQNFPRQLHSHLRGAINLGASCEEVDLVLRTAEICAGAEACRPAWQVWSQIRQQVCQNGAYSK